MAEYSKEYGFDWHDFSIKEEFDKLQEGQYIGQICEGFGFVAISKYHGNCEVALPVQGSDKVVWKHFDFDTNTIVELKT